MGIATAMQLWFSPMGTNIRDLLVTFIIGSLIGLFWPIWWGSIAIYAIKDKLDERKM